MFYKLQNNETVNADLWMQKFYGLNKTIHKNLN